MALPRMIPELQIPMNIKTIHEQCLGNEEWYYEEPIVFDPGSQNTKIGLLSSPEPLYAPSFFRRYTPSSRFIGMSQKERYFGDEIFRHVNEKRHPLLDNKLHCGFDTHLRDAEVFERIYHEAVYNHLRRAPEEHPLILSISPYETAYETLLMLFFETFNHALVSMRSSSSLALYAVGKEDGIVVDAGHSKTEIVPVWQGQTLQNAGHLLLEPNGRIIHKHIEEEFVRQGISFGNQVQFDPLSHFMVTENVVRNGCTLMDGWHQLDSQHGSRFPSHFFQSTYFSELAKETLKKIELMTFQNTQREFILPDKSTLRFNHKCLFTAANSWFDHPIALGVQSKKMIPYNCIPRERPPIRAVQSSMISRETIFEKLSQVANTQLHPDVQKQVAKDIVLCGGVSAIEGFGEKFSALTASQRGLESANVLLPYNRRYLSWTGGRLLAEYSAQGPLEGLFVSKEIYDEYGPCIGRECIFNPNPKFLK